MITNRVIAAIAVASSLGSAAVADISYAVVARQNPDSVPVASPTFSNMFDGMENGTKGLITRLTDLGQVAPVIHLVDHLDPEIEKRDLLDQASEAGGIDVVVLVTLYARAGRMQDSEDQHLFAAMEVEFVGPANRRNFFSDTFDFNPRPIDDCGEPVDPECMRGFLDSTMMDYGQIAMEEGLFPGFASIGVNVQ